MHLATRFYRNTLFVALVASALFVSRAQAIILADNQYRNKSAPTGSLANSGWQFEGDWGSFIGIPIAKNYFVTASHVGGSVGQSLTLNGKSYKTTAMYDDPNSDLRIWKTSSSFSSYATLYTGTSEVGKTAVMFGRGTQRGNAITVDGTTHGWTWGAADERLSWGENKIKAVVNGGSGIGQALDYSFDRSGHGDHVSNEGILSAGDSSGGMFIDISGKWELAAINYSVDGPFSLTKGGSTFLGAIYDKGGLYYNGSKITDTSTDIPELAYATRISSNMSWINSVLKGSTSASAAVAIGALTPEPGSLSLLVIGAGALLRRRRR